MPGMRRARMIRRLVALAALAGMLAASASVSADDSYLLALTWLPGFCAVGDHGTSLECKSAAGTVPHLVLHGLWPDWDVNGDGRRDAADDFCLTDDALRRSIIARDAKAAQDGNWLALPAVQLSAASSHDLDGVMPGRASALDRHEWWKHGTCSGLGPDDYFATAILLDREVERGSLARAIVAQAGNTIARDALLAAFATDFGARTANALTLVCAKAADGSALIEIRVRLKRASVTQGLNADDLDVPPRAPGGNCPAEIRIPDWGG